MEEIVMTSLAVWPGIDSRGLSTIYIASDSRLSWSGSADSWDRGVKVFVCPLTPDIFGFYGDVLVPSMVLPRIVEGPILASLPDSLERHASVYQMVRSCADALPGARRGTFGIFHASRDRKGQASNRLLWHTQWNPEKGWSDTPIPLAGISALTVSAGSGEFVVSNHTSAARTELGAVSRSVFTGFCDGLISGDDPRSGGPPQLVGLYRQGYGMHFGVIFQGKSYYRGVDAMSLAVPNLEWRNELFERCDSSGQRLIGAQAQPRLGKPKDS
jgi:hypothetical protein